MIAAIIVAAIAAAPAHGAWSYSSSRDQMRSATERQACTRSLNVVRLGFPYRSQALRLCIRDGADGDLDVYLELPAGGQFLCSAGSGCTVQARFDDAPVTEISASASADGDPAIIFLGRESATVEALRDARRVIFEVDFYRAGTQQLTFNVRGLRWADRSSGPPPSLAGAPDDLCKGYGAAPGSEAYNQCVANVKRSQDFLQPHP